MLPHRETYQPSGCANWARLALCFALTLPLALLSGYLLMLAFRWGLYFVVIVPLCAGLFAAGGVWLAVLMGKCRNRWAGLATGIAAGSIAFLSYYHFDLVHNLGIANLHRVDLLPEHILLRVKTDRVGKLTFLSRDRDGFDPAMEQARGTRLAFNWGLLLLEAAAVIALPAAAGWARAGRPFSEKYNRWLFDHTVHVERDTAREIAEALASEDADDLAEAVVPARMSALGNQGQLRLFYIPYEPATPIYLSLWINQGMLSWQTWPEHLAKMVRLTPEEAIAVAMQLHPPGVKIAEVVEVEAAAERPAETTASATIEELPAPEVGNVTAGRNYALLFLINLMPLLLGLFVVIGLIVLMIVTWSATGPFVKVGIGLVAFAVVVVTLVLTAMYADYLPMYLQQQWLKAAIRKRRSTLVDPDDDGVYYVGIIPRKNWGKLMVENAEDIGFVKVDRERRAVLFEGDKHRWAIPADSIESCEMEEFCIGLPEAKESNVFPLVVLRANVGGKVWEAPLCPAKITPRRQPGPVRREWTRPLWKEIHKDLLADAGWVQEP